MDLDIYSFTNISVLQREKNSLNFAKIACVVLLNLVKIRRDDAYTSSNWTIWMSGMETKFLKSGIFNSENSYQWIGLRKLNLYAFMSQKVRGIVSKQDTVIYLVRFQMTETTPGQPRAFQGARASKYPPRHSLGDPTLTCHQQQELLHFFYSICLTKCWCISFSGPR